jgi:hypothetical protein
MDVFVELPRIKGLDTHALSMTKERFLPALPGTTSSTMDSSDVEVLQQSEKGEGRGVDDGEREITPMVERSDGMEGSSSDTIAQDAEEEEDEEEVVREHFGYETLVIDQEEEDKDDSSSSSASDSDSDSEDDSEDDSESDASSTITSPSSPSSIPDLNLLLAAALQTASTTAAQKAKEREERNVFGDDVMKLEQVVKER